MNPFICKSTAMAEVARRIQRAAQAECPVLVSGEQGTGKKLVAKTIHRQSRRKDGPFMMVHTEQVRGQTLEDELFGSLARAEGGTLVIDEITGLPRTAQAKLLEITEKRFSQRLVRPAFRARDIRLITITRYPLTESVQRGTMREDTPYRFAVVHISVPPLRERKEDIPALIRSKLTQLCAAGERPVPALERDVMRYLVKYPWPGNVSQLWDCLGTMVLAEDASKIHVDTVRAWLSHNGIIEAPEEKDIKSLAAMERAAVLKALRAYEGNRTRAARALGISVRTLQRKLRHWANSPTSENALNS